MAAPSLPESLIEAGHRLVTALDHAGLEAEGAAWIYDYALQEWRFVVATSLVETIGRTQVYRMLLSVMSRLDLPEGITIDDIHLLSTESGMYKGIGSVFKAYGGILRLESCSINDKRIDAIIYRWGVKPTTKADAKAKERKFSKRIRELSS